MPNPGRWPRRPPGRDPTASPAPRQQGGNYNREPHAVHNQSFPLKLMGTPRRGLRHRRAARSQENEPDDTFRREAGAGPIARRYATELLGCQRRTDADVPAHDHAGVAVQPAR